MSIAAPLQDLEELARHGRDWAHARRLAGGLPSPAREAYEAILDTFERRPAAPGTAQPLDAATRRSICRFVLLSLDAHTDAPAWSSDLLQRLMATLLGLKGLEPADLFKAQWELILAHGPALTPVLAAFLRSLALTVLFAKPDPRVELQWLVDADLAVTPAEGFFKLQTFVLRPELYDDGVEAEVLLQLRDDPVGKPYVGR